MSARRVGVEDVLPASRSNRVRRKVRGTFETVAEFGVEYNEETLSTQNDATTLVGGDHKIKHGIVVPVQRVRARDGHSHAQKKG